MTGASLHPGAGPGSPAPARVGAPRAATEHPTTTGRPTPNGRPTSTEHPNPTGHRVPTGPRPVLAHHVQDVVLSIAGHTVKGRFTPANLELRIVSRPWAGALFPSPAAAAAAVTDYFGAGRRSDAPGWRVARTGVVLRAPAAAHRGLIAAHRATAPRTPA